MVNLLVLNNAKRYMKTCTMLDADAFENELEEQLFATQKQQWKLLNMNSLINLELI